MDMAADPHTIATARALSAPPRLKAAPQALAAADNATPGDAARGPFAEWRMLADLAEIAAPWRRLAARSLEANIFYEPDFVLAGAPAWGRDVGAVLVWADAGRHSLRGLFPARIAGWRAGFPLAVTLGWTHPYAPLGTPLVDRDDAASTLAAWLDFIARDKTLPRRILLPLVPTEGRFADALASALAARGASVVPFGEHRRALLAPAGARDTYLAFALSAKKRKEVARQRRRLAERGELKTTDAAGPAGVSVALDSFMALEQSGWKGRRRSAAAQNAATRDFMRQALTALAERGQVRIMRLAVASQDVAAGILLRSGTAGWFWKIAYDEEVAQASPGVQLALELTRAALDDGTLATVDSCAVADHPMIDHLWRERLALADRLIVLQGASRPARALAPATERLRRAALDSARGLRNRLRGIVAARRARTSSPAAAGLDRRLPQRMR